MSNVEIKKIIKYSKKIIAKAILLGGSSIKDFSSTGGKKGTFQQYFSVYGKKGEKCSNKNCGNVITKIVISNRASFIAQNVKNNKVDRVKLHIYTIVKYA